MPHPARRPLGHSRPWAGRPYPFPQGGRDAHLMVTGPAVDREVGTEKDCHEPLARGAGAGVFRPPELSRVSGTALNTDRAAGGAEPAGPRRACRCTFLIFGRTPERG